MDHEAAATELLRAMRGKRSQLALSRRLGLRSNAVYRWEAGRAWPTAQQLFRMARVTGRSVIEPLKAFAGAAHVGALETPRGAATLLETLAQPFTVQALAKKLGVSRFVLSRWLSGKSAIRLPELLRFVETTTLRLLDFIALFVDPAHLPSLSVAFRRLTAARATAYDVPWSHAILRALELEDYRKLGRHETGWLGRRIGVAQEEEERCIALLVASGQIRRRRGRYVVAEAAVVDTSVDLVKRRALRAFWSSKAVERLSQGDPGLFGYNLFAIAEADIEKLQALYIEFFAKMRALVDASHPSQRVMLLATQLVALDQPEREL